jgi:putative flippase GtrA
MALTDTTEGRIIARWIEEKGIAPYLPPLAIRLLGLANQISRYAIVSALALALDFSVYIALTNGGHHAALAGVAGYLAGMLLHFSLSTRYVFKRKVAGKSQSRLLAEFAVSGLVGLLITASVIAIATDMLGLSPVVAKAFAVAMSFLAVFLLRRSVVFQTFERRRKPRE